MLDAKDYPGFTAPGVTTDAASVLFSRLGARGLRPLSATTFRSKSLMPWACTLKDGYQIHHIPSESETTQNCLWKRTGCVDPGPLNVVAPVWLDLVDCATRMDK